MTSKLSARQIMDNLAHEGVRFKSFTLASEGRYSAQDADWNYKDIPHLSLVHDLVDAYPTVIGDYELSNICFQKIPPFFRFPMCLTNYDYDEKTQIYYTSLLFFILVIETSIIPIKENYTKVETTYNIGACSPLALFFFPILRWAIKRNYKNLMKGDIPMRIRRGELRDRGYRFVNEGKDGKVTFPETTKLNNVHVIIPEEFCKSHNYEVTLQRLKDEKDVLLGKNDDRGIRITLSDDQIRIYKRVCHHQGADLSQATSSGNFLTCPWHGNRISPMVTIDTEGEDYRSPEIDVLRTDQSLHISVRIKENAPLHSGSHATRENGC